ncbi:MAG: dipeptidase [Lachnospiraceae bacterium]|jgi:membrane dipeptidase|nr:dipeptidase [Lachnospiraceae bacterium]
MIFDTHGDIFTDVTIRRLNGETDVIKNRHLARFKEGGMVGGAFVIWIDPPYDTAPKQRMLDSIRCVSAELSGATDILNVITDKAGFYQSLKEEKLAVLMVIEGLQAIGEDVDYLYVLHRLGFRQASLTWNEQNDLATGVKGDPERGLTEAGKKAVRIMEELGMMIDLSHANDKTFYDILSIATKPLIASHSNARSLCAVPRNLTDEQIKLVAQTGGVIGLNAFAEFISPEKEKRDLEHFIDHADYMKALVGNEHLAFGFDFIDYLGDNTLDSFVQDTSASGLTKDLESISCGKKVIEAFKKRGYTDEEMEGIGWKNYIELF